MKFIKKSGIVEAEQLTTENLYTLEKWCGGSVKGTKVTNIEERAIDIQTIDWIIKEVDGKLFCPCKSNIFKVTHEIDCREMINKRLHEIVGLYFNTLII